MSKTRIYKIWSGMIKRCSNINSSSYKRYGGRGVSVCQRWLNYDNFFSDMSSTYKDGLSLDRYPDNNGNYEPGNCRWATYEEQGSNKRNNRILNYMGESKTISQWSRIYQIDYKMISDRLKRGWSIEDSISKEKQKCGGNHRPK